MRIILLIVIVALNACARMPSRTELEGGSFGPKPTEKQVMDHLSEILIDAESARYKEILISRGWINRAGVMGGSVVRYGWCADARVNAKNRYGGYTGYSTFKLFFADNSVNDRTPDKFVLCGKGVICSSYGCENEMKD